MPALRRVVCAALVLSMLMNARTFAATPRSSQDDIKLAVVGAIVVTAVIAVIVAIATRGDSGSSAKQIRAAFDPWVGRDVNALINDWGAPSGVFPMPDGRSTIYTWLYQGGTLMSTTANAFGSSSVANQHYCRFDWTASTVHRIESYRWEGICRVSPRQGSQAVTNSK